MKILLLSVNSESLYYGYAVMPFGLACLGSFVQSEDIEVSGIDMNVPAGTARSRYLRPDPDLIRRIKEHSPDLVGMSVYSENVFNVMFWAEQIKKVLPQTTVVVGGNHASYIAGQLMEKCRAIDFVVRFEGEEAFRGLCMRLKNRQPVYHDIKGLVYRENGVVVENELGPLIPDLSVLPAIDRDIFLSGDSESNTGQADAITARGCPFHCVFCNCNHYWGKVYRSYPIDSVIRDLTHLKDKFPDLTTVRFRDESISINKRRCLELCSGLTEQNLDLEFEAHSRLDGLDEDVIAALARAGFRKLYIGLESGSPDVLKRLKKGINIEKAEEVISRLRTHGIGFRISLMLGTPGESIDESRQTIALVKKLELSFDDYSIGHGLVVYPGTAIAHEFLEKHPDYKWLEPGNLEDGYWQNHDSLGNPISVSMNKARYDTAQIQEVLAEEFKERLRPYNEKYYFRFRASYQAVRILRNLYGSDEAIRETVSHALSALDELGFGWGVYGSGKYFMDIVRPSLTIGKWRNFAGVMPGRFDGPAVPAGPRLRLLGARFMVTAVPAAEGDPSSLPGFETLNLDRLLLSGKWKERLLQGPVDPGQFVDDWQKETAGAEVRRRFVTAVERLSLVFGLHAPLVKIIRKMQQRGLWFWR